MEGSKGERGHAIFVLRKTIQAPVITHCEHGRPTAGGACKPCEVKAEYETLLLAARE